MRNYGVGNKTRVDTHDSEDPGLAGGVLAGPCEVAGLETEGAVLEVTPTDTNGVHPLGAKLGVGWLTAELEFSLLTVVGALCPSLRSFVPGGPRDTCMSSSSKRRVVEQAFKTIC